MPNPPSGIARALSGPHSDAPAAAADASGRLDRAFGVDDVEALGRERLGPGVAAAIDAVSGPGITARANRDAFRRHNFVPRVLVNVETIDCTTTVLGGGVSLPVLLGPLSGMGRFHPDGERAAARGARRAGTVLCVATDCGVPIEDVAAEARTWVQLAPAVDTARTLDEVARAEAAGCAALVVGDGAASALAARRLAGSRWAVERTVPVEAAGPPPTWAWVDWLHGVTRLPIVLRGVLGGAEARLAGSHGVAAVIVSNEGGRDLDGTVPALGALTEVVEASDGRFEVYVEGGVRRGSDVAMALALGARAVVVGRQFAWGLAAGGDAGVVRMLELIRGELRSIMGNAGVPTIDRIGPGLLS